MPMLIYELYLRGFKPHGLAHPGHWNGPLGPFFEQFGAVKAGCAGAPRGVGVGAGRRLRRAVARCGACAPLTPLLPPPVASSLSPAP
jgi:hypothetical protein